MDLISAEDLIRLAVLAEIEERLGPGLARAAHERMRSQATRAAVIQLRGERPREEAIAEALKAAEWLQRAADLMEAASLTERKRSKRRK